MYRKPTIGFFTNNDNLKEMYDRVLGELWDKFEISRCHISKDSGVIESDFVDIKFKKSNSFQCHRGMKLDLIIVDGIELDMIEYEYIDSMTNINNGYCILYEDFVINDNISKYTFVLNDHNKKLSRSLKFKVSFECLENAVEKVGVSVYETGKSLKSFSKIVDEVSFKFNELK